MVSSLEKKVRDLEKSERDGLRRLHEREVLYDQLKEEAKVLSDAKDQAAETIAGLEQNLTDARNR